MASKKAPKPKKPKIAKPRKPKQSTAKKPHAIPAQHDLGHVGAHGSHVGEPKGAERMRQTIPKQGVRHGGTHRTTGKHGGLA